MKISIIGTGRVGSTLGFAVVMKGLANELVLVNRTHAVAVGEALVGHCCPVRFCSIRKTVQNAE